MTLTEQQRKKIVELVEHDINESQSSTRYWFDHDEVTLIWVNDDEVYYALKKDGTWEYYSPSDIESFADTLSDPQLRKWFCEDYYGCDDEDFEEYLEDEMEAAR